MVQALFAILQPTPYIDRQPHSDRFNHCLKTKASRSSCVVRTFRDQREAAYDAVRYLKARHPTDFVEVLDRSTGTKLIVFEDGRVV